VIGVRADTAAFARDVQSLCDKVDISLPKAADRAGRAIESALMRAISSGKLGFDELKAVALSVMAEIAAGAIRAGIGSVTGKSGDAGAGLLSGLIGLLGLGMLGCMNRAFKTQPLATVPTFRCNRAIERVGRLCLRHPLPAVVFAEDAPIAAVIQVDDTVTALGFDLPIFLNVVGRQHFGADTVILTGYFFIPVPDVATGDRWNHVIQNSHRNVEGTTLQTSDGEWVIRYEWSAPKRAFSWFRRS